MPNVDHTIDFWQSVANEFKSDLGVLFDLYNEPYPDNNQVYLPTSPSSPLAVHLFQS